MMNEAQQSHIDYYLQRLEYWKGRKPAYSTAWLLAARDTDGRVVLRAARHPLVRRVGVPLPTQQNLLFCADAFA